MNRIRTFLSSYHPIVHSLLLGTVLARAAGSMSLPFLAVYLSLHGNLTPTLIGIIIGTGSLAGTVGGFIGGTLSDRLGRRKVMMTALYIWGLVFIGFALADQPWMFILLSTLNGLCRSFFEPVSQALMGDLTDPSRRFHVFSLRYTAINIGVAVGPLIGAYLGIAAGPQPFLVTGVVYLLYAISLNSLLNRFGIRQIEGQKKEQTSFHAACPFDGKIHPVVQFDYGQRHICFGRFGICADRGIQLWKQPTRGSKHITGSCILYRLLIF